jgi:hypothetical protein
MSRKDFVAVAAAINALYTATDIRELIAPDGLSTQTEEDRAITASKLFGIRYTAEALADVFSDANPRFNRNIFLAACGVNGGAK